MTITSTVATRQFALDAAIKVRGYGAAAADVVATAEAFAVFLLDPAPVTEAV